MPVAEGHFALYSKILPPLEAGTFRLTATQALSATHKNGPLTPDKLPVEALSTHLRVRAPRFALPPDQVLSTFPPAASEGSYAMRLPQVVIKRRTLPWERLVQPGLRGTPWLALVVIAEGEAELKMNQPVAECATAGKIVVSESDPADAEVGNYLEVRESVVHRVFPTQADVPLLAHAREVDIHDTELMQGDDDGFLAVVIANRLPVPGRDAAGAEVPVKYLACLVNLEGQWDVLLDKAPPPSLVTLLPRYEATVAVGLGGWDHLQMGSANTPYTPRPVGAAGTVVGDAAACAARGVLDANGDPVAPALDPDTGDAGDAGDAIDPAAVGDAVVRRSGNRDATARALGAARAPRAVGDVTAAPVEVVREGTAAFEPASQWTRAGASRTRSAADVYAEMAVPFGKAYVPIDLVRLEPVYRFPVLLHWSFTSTGDVTFRSLMEGLDSGLLGTVGETPAPAPGVNPPPTPARPPLEVVETGHVGLAHRTRRGEAVRAWYRGPCVPHPTADPPGGRLPLAHASDQLRIVVPDGREDLSLASAFEIGRLLALARPSMISALLRWRQTQYQTARRRAVWSADSAFLRAALGEVDLAQLAPDFGVVLGRLLAGTMAARPATFLGAPRPLVDAGRPLSVDGPASRHLAAAFEIPAAVFRGDTAAALGRLRTTGVVVAPSQLGGLAGASRIETVARAELVATLDQQLGSLFGGTLGSTLNGPSAAVPTRPGGVIRGSRRRAGRQEASPPAPDALDHLVAALERAAESAADADEGTDDREDADREDR